MTDPTGDRNFDELQKQIIELAIRLGALFVLLWWCFRIVEPFVLIIIWAIIVAIALYPLFSRLTVAFGGHYKLVAALLSLLLIIMLVAPSVMLADSLMKSAEAMANTGEHGDIKIPLPPESIADWPLIGETAYTYWQRAATNLPSLLAEFSPQIKAFGRWLLSTITGTGLTFIQFLASFLIAGVFLANAGLGKNTARAFASRLAGHRGPEFAALAAGTIRNVATGIVGISILQTALLSVGYVAINLPAAGLAAFITLTLCIIQVGPTLIGIPAIIYVFWTADTLPASLFAIWTVIAMLIDNILKPLVFSRGASVPTLIIFAGSIGGMLMSGLIGLFIGPVVLSVGFILYRAWLGEIGGELTGQQAGTSAD